MVLPKPTTRTDGQNTERRSLDSVINATSIIQKPLFVLLFRGLPFATMLLGMSFLAPKIQKFSCVSTSANASHTQSTGITDTMDLRCYTNVGEVCTEWSYDTSIFRDTVKSEFNTVCEWEWMIHATESFVVLGIMVGNLIFSHVSDWYGRNTSDIVSLSLSFIGGLAVAAAPNAATFMIFRTLAAIGIGGGQVGSFTHSMESVSPKKRAAIPFCDNIGYISGILILPLISWYYRENWRYVQVMHTVVNLPSLIIALITDESPRWLLATGRKERARPIIRRLLKKNGMPHTDEDFEEVIESTQIIGEETPKANIRRLFRSPGVSLITISFFVQFLIALFVYHDLLFFVVNEGDNPWQNFLYTGLFEVPPLLIVLILVKYCRRKLLYLILYSLTGVFAGTLLLTDENQDTLHVILGSISKTGADLLVSILGVHVNESFITRERSLAFGLCKTFSRFGAMITPLLKNMGMTFHAYIDAGLCLLAIVAALPLKETLNKPLADNDEDDLAPAGSISCSKSETPKNSDRVAE